MYQESEILQQLARSININEIKAITNWAFGNEGKLEELFTLINFPDDRIGKNVLWCLCHCQKMDRVWLQTKQNELIDMLLNEQHTGRKRMLLQILHNQSYDKDSLRTDFIDFCLSKINSECEPYVIRAYCIYCAYQMCCFYPELLAELAEHLAMLEYQSLSPGLLSALKNTRRLIAKNIRRK